MKCLIIRPAINFHKKTLDFVKGLALKTHVLCCVADEVVLLYCMVANINAAQLDFMFLLFSLAFSFHPLA